MQIFLFFLDLAIDIGKPNHEEFLLLPSHQNNEERTPQFSLIKSRLHKDMLKINKKN